MKTEKEIIDEIERLTVYIGCAMPLIIAGDWSLVGDIERKKERVESLKWVLAN